MAGRMTTAALVRLSLGLLLLLWSRAPGAEAWVMTNWGDAHATFYGGQDASGTMGGACGYGNLYSVGYGTSSTALSNALFNKGLSCGACYEIECKLSESRFCYAGASIVVTATNACPPGSEGGWCDNFKRHFDLSYPAFQKLAQPVGGVIPVRYKRVSCNRHGGIRFTMRGNPYFDLVLVTNVGEFGAVQALEIRGERTGWNWMRQNWGANWQSNVNLQGQALTFKVTLDNGKKGEFWNVAPRNWGFGQTFEADYNF